MNQNFMSAFTAGVLVIMTALLVCGVFIQREKAARPTAHMICKTVEHQNPAGDWTCVIWHKDMAESKKYFN